MCYVYKIMLGLEILPIPAYNYFTITTIIDFYCNYIDKMSTCVLNNHDHVIKILKIM